MKNRNKQINLVTDYRTRDSIIISGWRFASSFFRDTFPLGWRIEFLHPRLPPQSGFYFEKALSRNNRQQRTTKRFHSGCIFFDFFFPPRFLRFNVATDLYRSIVVLVPPRLVLKLSDSVTSH